MAFLHVYQNGIYTVALLLLPAACATREKYTRDMVFLHVYQNTSAATTTQQLVPQGEIYTQDSILHAYIVKGRNIHPGIMAFLHVYIRMGSTRCCHQLLPAACATREKYTPRDMAFLHVYIRMGSTRCHQLLPAACATRRNIHRDMAFHVYQILHGAADLLSSLCQGEKYTPRDMAFLHVYIRMGSTRAKLTLPAAGISTLGLGLIYILACDWTETYLLPTSLGIKVRVLPLPLPGIGSGANPISLFRTRGSSKPKWHGAQKQASVFFTRPTENGLGPGKVWDGTIAEMPFSAGWYNGIMEITDEEYE
jgi:hypothetical protein